MVNTRIDREIWEGPLPKARSWDTFGRRAQSGNNTTSIVGASGRRQATRSMNEGRESLIYLSRGGNLPAVERNAHHDLPPRETKFVDRRNGG